MEFSASLELSAVVLDVDRTLIRSVRKTSSNNPYPRYRKDEYFHFTLSANLERSNSLTSSTKYLLTEDDSDRVPTFKKYPPSSPQTLPSNQYRTRYLTPKQIEDHYHIYIRPGLKKLMIFLKYLQQHTRVKMVIASMAKRDYVESILKGLKKHCGERKFPKFDAILSRENWDENKSPNSKPTMNWNVLIEQYQKYGAPKRLNCKFKSIAKIAEICNITNETDLKNILVIDDDMGYYDHDDRVSGQIYQIPAWNGPVPERKARHNITVYPQGRDNQLPSLGAMIQAIVDKGSIKEYLFSRVLSVFRYEYGSASKYNKQMKLRKQLLNKLMNDIGMSIDEDTAIASMWMFDNALKCCKPNGKHAKDSKNTGNNQQPPIGELMEVLFGCIIVYQMYIYDCHPSAHFYRTSFSKNDFWKNVMKVYFDYYVRLLINNKDARIPSYSFKYISSSKNTNKTNKIKKPIISTTKRGSNFLKNIINNTKKTDITSLPQTFTVNKPKNIAPIEVAQSDTESVLQKSEVEAQEEMIINNNSNNIEVISISSDDENNINTPTPNSNQSDRILVTQQIYASIQDHLKVLVKSISKSLFCKNMSPVCLIGQTPLLSASRSNPVPKVISKYQKVLKKVYRDRGVFVNNDTYN